MQWENRNLESVAWHGSLGDRAVVSLSWLMFGEYLCGKDLERKGPYDDGSPGPNLWVKCAPLARV